jgi:hypothetical protein
MTYLAYLFNRVSRNMTIYPVRISFKTACQILDVSRETLNNIIKLDPDFPPKIKTGTSRQSPVYFDYMQIIEWHNSQKQSLAVLEA